MSFIVVATEVFGAGLAAEIAAGALMGGSVTIGANVLRGKNPFDNIGQGLLLGGLTAGISSGLGNSLSSAGVTENAAQEAVRTGSLTPDLAGPNINSLGNSVESSYANAIPAPPSAPPGGLESLAPAPATPMPSGGYPVGSAEYLNAEAGLSTATPIPSTPVSYPPGSAEYLNAEASTVGGPAAPSSATPSSATPSSAAPSDATTPADFNRNRISPASDYKGTLRSSGLPSLNQVGQFAKDNWKTLTGIAAIGLLNQPKPGVNVPTRDPGGFHTGYYDPITHRMVDTGGYVSYKNFGDKNIRDYTHARNGGLMGLANGGAVAFADGGGVNMFSPYVDLSETPVQSNFVTGGGNTGGEYGAFGSKEAYDKAVAMQTAKTNAENAARDAYQIPPDSPFYGASKVAMGDNLNNIKEQAYEFQQRQENRAKLAAANPGEEITGSGPNNEGYNYGASKFGVTSKDYLPNVKTTTDVPRAGGNPPDREKAQGIQTLAKPDTPATTTSAPQIVHGNIYDPVTGHYRNPTNEELGAKAVADARGNTSEMDQLYSQYFKTYKPGEVLDFAGGTLTKNVDGSATHKYKDANGKEQSYTLWPQTDLATVAKNDPAIAAEWKNMFNYTVPTGTGSPIISTPGPTGPVLTPGTGGSGRVTQVPTGFTPPVAPPTRVPTSIEDFNKRFNTMTPGGDSEAMMKYLMGEGPEPKGTTNTEVAAPYWEKMGMAPVDKTRSSRIYDPTLKNAAGKVVGGYVANPDFKPKVFDPVTKRLIDAPSSTSGSTSGATQYSKTPVTEAELTNHDSKPNQDPGPDAEWVWIPATKRWVAIQNTNNANGGMIGYAAGGLGSLGGYSDGGRLLKGPGDGVSDSIPASIGNRQPARLADGEFVVPARIVSELGNGSTEAGARRLYQMMDRVQHARKKSIGKNKVATDSRAEQYLPV